MYCMDRIGSYGGAGIIVHDVQSKVEQWLRQMNADLTASRSHGVDDYDEVSVGYSIVSSTYDLFPFPTGPRPLYLQGDSQTKE